MINYYILLHFEKIDVCADCRVLWEMMISIYYPTHVDLILFSLVSDPLDHQFIVQHNALNETLTFGVLRKTGVWDAS